MESHMKQSNTYVLNPMKHDPYRDNVPKSSENNVKTIESGGHLELKLTERRKRTFNILKKFDHNLASEVIYKEGFH